VCALLDGFPFEQPCLMKETSMWVGFHPNHEIWEWPWESMGTMGNLIRFSVLS